MKLTPEKIVISNALILIVWLLVHEMGVEKLAPYMSLPANSIKALIDIILVLTTSFSLFYAFKKQRKSQLYYANEYKNIFKASPFPLWIYESETLKFIEVNAAAEDHYGYTRKEFLSMTILDIREVSARNDTSLAAAQMPETYKSSGYWEHIKKSGEVVTVLISSRKIRFRNRDCVMVIAQDVTIQFMQERKLNELYRAEQEHKKLLESHLAELKKTLEEKELLAEVIDRINNLAIITDASGHITWVNKAFVRHTGYQLDEITGRSPNFLHGPMTDPTTQAAIMESLHQRDFRSFEILNYTKSGEEYWVDMTFSPIYDEMDKIVRYISIQNIITERKVIDEKIRDQNKVLRNIAWTNSHSLRKPVASIVSLVNISNEMELPADIKEIHNLIGACAEELDTITKDIAEKIENYPL